MFLDNCELFDNRIQVSISVLEKYVLYTHPYLITKNGAIKNVSNMKSLTEAVV